MSCQFIERPQQCDGRLMHNNISIKVIVHKNDSVIIPKLHEFLSSAFDLICKSMATANYLVNNILQNIFFCFLLKNESHTGLE